MSSTFDRSPIQVHRQKDEDVFVEESLNDTAEEEIYIKPAASTSASAGLGSYSSREYLDQAKGRGAKDEIAIRVKEEEDEEESEYLENEEDEIRTTTVVDYAPWEQTTFRVPAWLACIVAYGLLLVGGAMVGMLEKKSYYVCFHGYQSFMLNVCWLPFLVPAILGDILLFHTFGMFFISFVWLGLLVFAALLCAIFAVLRAPDGLPFHFPIVGSVALSLTDKTFGN